MDARRQLTSLRQVLAVGLLATFAAAPRLWLAGDVIGPVPVGGGRSPLGAPLDVLVLGLLVAGLLPMLRTRCSRRWILAWGALLLARAAWDRLLWQPFLLHEATALLLLACVPDERADEAEGADVLGAQRLIVVLIYVASGFAKLHHRFLVDGPTLVEATFGFEGPSTARFIVSLAVALGEALGGLALLSERTRRPALVLLVGMHVAILARLGPWADGHNPIVWPWNVVMVASLVVLFGRRERGGTGGAVPAAAGSSGRGASSGPASPWRARVAVALLFGVAPALSYLGAWDEYLSFRLYALRYPDAFLLLRLEDRGRLPASVEAAVLWEPAALRPARGFDGYLSVPHWVESEVGAFSPPSHAVTRELARRLLRALPEDVDATLELRPVPDAWTGAWEPELVPAAALRGP